MNLKKKSDKSSLLSSSNKHPKFSEMVLIAIAMLNERNGSSIQAIKKYISKSFNVDSKKISHFVKKYLMMAVASGTLVQTKGKGALGSFRLGGTMKVKMSELIAKFSDDKSESSPSQCDKKTSPGSSSKRSRKAKMLTSKAK